jgi:hypothetical protein
LSIYDKVQFHHHAEACSDDLVKLMNEEMPVGVYDLIMVNSTTGTTVSFSSASPCSVTLVLWD